MTDFSEWWSLLCERPAGHVQVRAEQSQREEAGPAAGGRLRGKPCRKSEFSNHLMTNLIWYQKIEPKLRQLSSTLHFRFLWSSMFQAIDQLITKKKALARTCMAHSFISCPLIVLQVRHNRVGPETFAQLKMVAFFQLCRSHIGVLAHVWRFFF